MRSRRLVSTSKVFSRLYFSIATRPASLNSATVGCIAKYANENVSSSFRIVCVASIQSNSTSFPSTKRIRNSRRALAATSEQYSAVNENDWPCCLQKLYKCETSTFAAKLKNGSSYSLKNAYVALRAHVWISSSLNIWLTN